MPGGGCFGVMMLKQLGEGTYRAMITADPFWYTSMICGAPPSSIELTNNRTWCSRRIQYNTRPQFRPKGDPKISQKERS
jgi:hypothetical protein